MILISCGSVEYSFLRLLGISTGLAQRYPDQQIIVQRGQTPYDASFPNLVVKDYFPHSEFVDMLKYAQSVISAAGETTVLQLLQYAQTKPILFPRLAKYGEHVDDQQLEIAKAVSKTKEVYFALNESQVFVAVKTNLTSRHKIKPRTFEVNQSLIQYLDSFSMIKDEFNSQD